MISVQNVIVQNSLHEFKVLTDNVVISSLSIVAQNSLILSGTNITLANCKIASNYVGISISGINIAVTNISVFGCIEAILSNCIISGSSQGIYITGTNITISNSTISGYSYGMNAQLPEPSSLPGLNRVKIFYSRFYNNVLSVQLRQSSYTKFELSDSVISDGYSANSFGVSGLLLYPSTFSTILVQNNEFRNLPYPAINVVSSYDSNSFYYYFQSTSTLLVNNNLFINISNTALIVAYAGSLTSVIKNNTFKDNNLASGPSAVSVKFADPYYNAIYGNFSMLKNIFQQNRGKTVVNFIDNPVIETQAVNDAQSVNITSNVFLNNIAYDSTIYSGGNLININFNIFSNPQTTYDLKVGFFVLQENCKNNWWGSSNQADIESRIHDNRDQNSLGYVLFEPFLNQSEFTCGTVSGCSNHGTCVFPEVCECSVGWEGSDCLNVSCANIYECLGRGRCVGPNVCQCDQGWLIPDCSQPTCYLQNNCSNHGVCQSPNV